ncbi:IQ motif containing H [Angomonas deanei]|uniref:IQCH-like ATP-grasp domain-containing protein n=1 Tax=Angomonas deanei TaxID=59799 RepID=A0A7G2C3Z2_9TRYP|nr:IQ motif containing H [Angomonas deanei]CAD2213437.1 hypothetical protein, conserved [Angomonas deanei]|eukprot:EPY39411.1 IQ motif containing H [Angomonas deanei]
MYKQRVAFVHLLLGTRAAFLIQRQWASYRAHCTTRRAIAARKETRLTRWRQTMDNFLTNWPRIADARRTIIHIPSLSLPPFHTGEVPFYLEQQLGQLTRLADLADPLVNIIMVAPFKPEQEILAYYFSMLEDAGVTNISGRFTILVPEDAKRLPKGVSLTRMTMLSFRLMKLLAAAGKGKPAYIVPCVVGMEELSLAAELNIPLLSPEPRVAQVFGVKSGCRRLLDSADVATPPGSTHIKGCSDLLRALASLMVEHRTVSRWLVKIETESGSRGHAYFDVSRIRALKSPPADTEELEKNIVREIEEEGQKRVRLVHNTYKTWTQFIEMVDKVGACVEAVPNKVVANLTANLFIEPGGEIRLCSVVEVTLSPAYTVMGCVFPPVSEIPYEAVRDAAVSVARAAFRKRIIGYMSVDFCVFVSGGNEKELACPRIWGVDVDLCLTNNAAAHQFVTVLTNSTFDPQTGQAAFDQTPLRYFYSGLIYNPFLSLVRHSNFFSLCQSRHLTFDKERKRGVVFHLVDVLLRGCIGVLTIDSNFTKAVKQMSDFQSLLNLELPKQGEHALDSNFVFFASSVRQLSRN